MASTTFKQKDVQWVQNVHLVTPIYSWVGLKKNSFTKKFKNLVTPTYVTSTIYFTLEWNKGTI